MKKDFLAIIRALAKWHMDLLGNRFEIWTDHKTLEHFDNQKDLSCRQARWMEFLSQYDASIYYLPGENNCIADALSRLPENDIQSISSIFAPSNATHTSSKFKIDNILLDEIKKGYATNPFIQKLTVRPRQGICLKPH